VGFRAFQQGFENQSVAVSSTKTRQIRGKNDFVLDKHYEIKVKTSTMTG
jgi:hypothetical protein